MTAAPRPSRRPLTAVQVASLRTLARLEDSGGGGVSEREFAQERWPSRDPGRSAAATAATLRALRSRGLVEPTACLAESRWVVTEAGREYLRKTAQRREERHRAAAAAAEKRLQRLAEAARRQAARERKAAERREAQEARKRQREEAEARRAEKILRAEETRKRGQEEAAVRQALRRTEVVGERNRRIALREAWKQHQKVTATLAAWSDAGIAVDPAIEPQIVDEGGTAVRATLSVNREKLVPGTSDSPPPER